MSMTLAVELEGSGFQADPDDPRPASRETFFHAGGVAHAAVDLDRLIGRADIRPFTDFIYDGDMLADEEYAEMGMTRPEKKWFDAADGLRTVGHLIGQLELRNADDDIEGCSIGDLLDELRAIAGILRKAEQLGERFSLHA